MSDRAEFLVFDGHAMIYRAIHRPGPRLSSRSGEPTSGTYAFTQTLLKTVQARNPTWIAMAVDPPRNTLWRRALYPKYKAKRSQPDKDIIVQVRRCRQIADALGIPVIEVPTYEADDVIATLASVCTGDECYVTAVASDKDLHQLYDLPEFTMYDPGNAVEKTRLWFDGAYSGLLPEELPDYQAFIGDGVDNVPGIKGVGPKAARTILDEARKTLAPLETFFDEDVSLPFSPGIAKALSGQRRRFALMRKLVTLVRDVPIPLAPEDLIYSGLNMNAAKPIFRQLGFKRWS